MAHIPRALVVEDDARMRRIVTKVLTGCGIMVRAAGDGVEALNAFRSSREEPELICADIRMPNMDGREFARRLRQEGVDVPIVFVSGTIAKDQEGYREKSHVYLVSKPFSPHELARIAREMLTKPRPRLGARTPAPPVASAAELPPLPSPDERPTPGFSTADFPKKPKSASLVVPQAPDRPFGGAGHKAEAPQARPPKPRAEEPAPTAPESAPPTRRSKEAHNTTVIFLKPISAVEVPSSGPSRLAAGASTTSSAEKPAPGAPAPSQVAPPRPPAAERTCTVNVERRIREDGRPALRKSGDWVPRLIIWPDSQLPDAQRQWCEAVASALGAVQSACGLQSFAFAKSSAPDAAGRLWRMRPGVQIDGQLFRAVIERRLRGLFLLAPAGAESALGRFLTAEVLDRGNVLTVGAVLADLYCTERGAVIEITFLREETAFLHALKDACGRTGCAMRRGEWTTTS